MEIRLLLIALVFICSCNGINIKDATIESVEVYKTPFGISGPLNYDEQDARTWTPYKIDKREDLEKIKLLLTLLLEAGKNKFDYTNTYLTADIHLTKGQTKVLYFNKFKIKFDGHVYENSPALIKILKGPPASLQK